MCKKQALLDFAMSEQTLRAPEMTSFWKTKPKKFSESADTEYFHQKLLLGLGSFQRYVR